MKTFYNTQEEATQRMLELHSENKWVITGMHEPDGRFSVEWFEHRTYVKHDGTEVLDELWLTKTGEYKLIQDLEPEHCRNILRDIIRTDREMAAVEDAIYAQMDAAIAGASPGDAFGEDLPEDQADNVISIKTGKLLH
jgi:hypothetical protein